MSDRNSLSSTTKGEADICQLYESGVGTPTLGRMIGRSQCYIDAVLSRGGINKRGPGRLPNRPRPERRIAATIRDEALQLYQSGMWANEVARRLPVSKPTVLKWARAANIEIRNQKLPTPDLPLLHSAGCSAREISRRTGLGRKLVLRRLRADGCDVRANAHAKWYDYTSPTAGKVRLHGTWEASYARVLDAWYGAGLIQTWQYEPDRLHLDLGTIYIPDFKVVGFNGTWAYHEVKGRLWGRSLEKVQMARQAGYAVVLLRRDVLSQICSQNGFALPS